MIAARYTQGSGRFAVEEVPMPGVGPGELLLRVEATGICGSDVKIVRGGHRKLRDGQAITLGHEFVGTVEQAGEEVSGFDLGDRVGVAPNIGCGNCPMCRRNLANMCGRYEAFGITFDGAHAEHVLVPAAAVEQGNVTRVPASMPAGAACLAEPLSCAISGVRNARIEAGDAVVVYGAGPMGLLCMMQAVARGASWVLAVDVDDRRLAAAASLGAAATVNPARAAVADAVAEHTSEQGADAVIIAAPAPALQREALALLAPFGRLCLFASWPPDRAAVELDTNAVHCKNLLVTGMTGGCNADYAAALELVASGDVDPRRIVSHVFAMSELARAYEVALSGEGLKVVVTADGEEAEGW